MAELGLVEWMLCVLEPDDGVDDDVTVDCALSVVDLDERLVTGTVPCELGLVDGWEDDIDEFEAELLTGTMLWDGEALDDGIVDADDLLVVGDLVVCVLVAVVWEEVAGVIAELVLDPDETGYVLEGDEIDVPGDDCELEDTDTVPRDD